MQTGCRIAAAMDFLFTDAFGKPAWMWLAFLSFVLFLLAFDLGVLHRKAHEMSLRESSLLSAFYIAIALAFGGWIWLGLGERAMLEYLTGYIVEKSLAMDNIFVIATIFSYFAIPRKYQHRVLVYGILGVIVLRAVMIGAGAAIVAQYEWVLHLFGAFLFFTGAKMLISSGRPYDVAENPILRLMQRRLPVTGSLHGEKLFVRRDDPRKENGKGAFVATPLFLALVLVEAADLIFAIDSIPAIFAITTDAYIVYTSNILAILGLRSLYFALAALVHRFVYLKHALSAVLIFVGGKILVADMLGVAKVSPAWSLSVTVAILACGIGASLWATRKRASRA